MTNNYPRLCGGTFFVLILQALKQRTSARGHIASERDGLSNPEVLAGLIRVINPDFKKPNKDTFSTNTSDYMKCKISRGTYFPFDEPGTISAFDKRIKNDYCTAYSSMSRFVEDFIDVGTAVEKDVWLVKALLELISMDESIGGDELFYSLESGQILTKNALSTIAEFSLSPFLLGIWHYILMNRIDNTVGAETYEKWHKAPDEQRGKWVFISSIGSGLNRDVKVNAISESDEDATLNIEVAAGINAEVQSPASPSTEILPADTDPKRITVNNYGTVQNQKFISIETMNGDINL